MEAYQALPPGMSEAEFHKRWADEWKDRAFENGAARDEARAELTDARTRLRGAVEALEEIVAYDAVADDDSYLDALALQDKAKTALAALRKR